MSDDLYASASGMRKVLMIANVFPPLFSVAGSIRVVKFVKYLPALGWQPVVLTVDDTKEYEVQRRQGSAVLLQDIPEQARIYRTTAGEPTVELLEKGRKAKRQSRLAAVIVKSLSRLRRLWRRYVPLADGGIAWLPFALSMGQRIVREEDVDVVFATCPPHAAALIGAILKRLTGKPLMLDFRDDWVDTPWHRSKPWPTRPVERWLERWAVRTADKVILVTEWSRDAFVARYPREPAGKFVFIPNGCDLEDFAILKQTDDGYRNRRFTIVHAGHLSEWDAWRRSPEAFFQALNRVMERHPGLEENLRVAFTGTLPEVYERLIQDMELSSVVDEVGHLPREDFVRFLKSADLLLAINYDGFATLIPGKIYEYWAVGGPPILLLSCPGAAQRLVEQHELGIAVAPYDVEAIQDALLTTYHKRQRGEPMRVNPAGIEAYDRRALAERLAEILSATHCHATCPDSSASAETI